MSFDRHSEARFWGVVGVLLTQASTMIGVEGSCYITRGVRCSIRRVLRLAAFIMRRLIATRAIELLRFTTLRTLRKSPIKEKP